MKQICLIFGFIIILFSTSCNKKETTLNNADLLARTWQADEVTAVQGAINGTFYKKGVSNNLLDFSKLRFTFNATGTFVFTDQDGKIGAGTWSFANNDTQILLKSGTDPVETLTVTRLTASNLDFSQTETITGQGTLTITLKMIPL
jgi:hypothetical protein